MDHKREFKVNFRFQGNFIYGSKLCGSISEPSIDSNEKIRAPADRSLSPFLCCEIRRNLPTQVGRICICYRFSLYGNGNARDGAHDVKGKLALAQLKINSNPNPNSRSYSEIAQIDPNKNFRNSNGNYRHQQLFNG